MSSKKAATVVTHGKRQTKTPKNVIALARTVCKGLAAGMIGVSFALLVYGHLLAYIAVFAAAALLAWAVEVMGE